jgi:hypothetical protein
MTEQEFISKLLDINQPIENNPTRISTLILLLRGARKLSGRNLITGIYEMNEINDDFFDNGLYHSYQFSGLMNYLIFLEQLGSIFKVKVPTKSSNYPNSIHQLLNEFSDLSDDKIFVVRALRNSLTHKFGLATAKNPQRNEMRHKFIISIERNTEIITMPRHKWSGNFDDKSDHQSTTIYLIDFLDLIEQVLAKLKSELLKNKLELNLTGGINELKARFTIIY